MRSKYAIAIYKSGEDREEIAVEFRTDTLSRAIFAACKYSETFAKRYSKITVHQIEGHRLKFILYADNGCFFAGGKHENKSEFEYNKLIREDMIIHCHQFDYPVLTRKGRQTGVWTRTA